MVRGTRRRLVSADPAELDVVLGRDADFDVGVDVAVAAAELGAALREDRLVALGAAQRRLVGYGPEPPRGHVADVAERAPVDRRSGPRANGSPRGRPTGCSRRLRL